MASKKAQQPGPGQGKCPVCGQIIAQEPTGHLHKHAFPRSSSASGECPGTGAYVPFTPAAAPGPEPEPEK